MACGEDVPGHGSPCAHHTRRARLSLPPPPPGRPLIVRAYIAGAQVKEEVTDCGKKVKDECAEELSNLEEAKTELKRLKEERRAKMQVRPSSATKD